MSDRVAFARLDSEHEVAELRRELGVVTDERDTALADNDRLRQIVGGDGELESALDVTLDGALAAVRHFAAERDALSAVIAEYEQQDEQVMALKAFAIYVSDLGRPSALMLRRRVTLDDLIDRASAALAAGLAAPEGETPDEPQRWAVDLLDCGVDYGVQICATWDEAEAFRRSYVDVDGHERVAVIRRASPVARLGYHERAPYLAAAPGPALPVEEQR